MLAPGAHLLSFGGTRTFHRMTCAIEDAGFEIRDCLMWLYGSGFPKSLNLGDGWGTALKPGWEPIIVARKPLRESTVAKQVAATGTGGLNVDACRVGNHEYSQQEWSQKGASRPTGTTYGIHKPSDSELPSGRWPPNVLLSHSPSCELVGMKRVKGITGGTRPIAPELANVYGKHTEHGFFNLADADGLETVEDWRCIESCPVAELDRQSGVSTGTERIGFPGGSTFGGGEMRDIEGRWPGGTGGASRFFPNFHYAAKASTSERNIGLDGLPQRSAGEMTGGRAEGSAGLQSPRAGAGRTSGGRNHHPTVKSIDLMEWLIQLITPPGGIVIDPFAGSGSTIVAAQRLGFRAIGIEQDSGYVELARARVIGDAPLFNLGSST